ncbi:MAG: ribonuclease HII [Patescibacteria group bacterium]|nr:ribonuclease HII [Patescibacteria group bacterium]
MRYPNFSEEKRLWKKRFKIVVGIDEAGRGPLAGPVFACAVVVYKMPKSKIQMLKIRDSKKLTPKQREEFYDVLINHKQIQWGIGRASERVVDGINVLQATKLAMKRAVKNLEKKLGQKADFLILDGRIKLDLDVGQKSIIKADNKVFSCAAASIIAKVSRDRLMRRHHRKYPEYGFFSHKGYGTRKHIAVLAELGPCKLHRKTFKPVIKYS